MLKKSILLLISLTIILAFSSCELDDSSKDNKTSQDQDTGNTNEESQGTTDSGGTTGSTEGTDNSSENSNNTTVLELIDKRGNITADETWQEGKIYYIADKLYIKAIVTIEPGTIVKFGKDKLLHTMDGGKIIANGTKDKKIIFTSKYDDIGGDSANSSVTPKKRDWEDMYINETGSVFNYCVFKYADEAFHMVSNAAAPHKITITNCTFNENWTGFSSDVEISDQSVIDNNRFYGNYEPMIIYITNKIGDNNKYTSEDGSVKNNRQAIIYSRGYSTAVTIKENISLTETDVPYLFSWSIEIKDNSVLTLSDGVVMQMGMGAVIRVNPGSDIDLGSTGIITSYLDDSLKGSPTSTINTMYYWEGIQDGTNSSAPYRANLDRVFFSEFSSK